MAPPATIRQISDRLCADAAHLHKAITALPDNYTNPVRLGLTNRLVGIRHALCVIHGGQPNPAIPSTNPANQVITEWWRHHHPADWQNTAARRRHAEQLYIVLHQLLLDSEHTSVTSLRRRIDMPESTAYFVFGNPARTRWRTLEPILKALGAHRDELWTLWKQAHARPAKTTPPPRKGNGLTPRKP